MPIIYTPNTCTILQTMYTCYQVEAKGSGTKGEYIMIKHLYQDKTVTANQLAKLILLDAIDSRACDPLDCHFEASKMTDKEMLDFRAAFDKQIARVEKFLGL